MSLRESLLPLSSFKSRYKGDVYFYTRNIPMFFFFYFDFHCRNSSIISSVLQNHSGATFQSREETISSPPLSQVDAFTLEKKKKKSWKLFIFHRPFPFCMWFFFRYCGKYGQEVGIKVIYTSEYSQLCQHQLHVRSSSEWIHFARGNGATIGSAFRHFGGHTSRSGKKTERWTHYSENIAFDNAHLFW